MGCKTYILRRKKNCFIYFCRRASKEYIQYIVCLNVTSGFDRPTMTIAVDLGRKATKQTSGFEIAVIECEFLLTHVNKC